ncbi:MAG: DUF2934 domain-containing protein [Deltaproteobacteria bacterium]|nr:DUF2934 domain-containing protein [Deltaproteobacteria bacterium]
MQHKKETRAVATSIRQQEDNQVGNYHTGPRNRAVTAAQRSSMIQAAAYLRAEKRGFRDGDPMQDWLDAEREVDAILAKDGRLAEVAAD